jgi:hypothetical protein
VFEVAGDATLLIYQLTALMMIFTILLFWYLKNQIDYSNRLKKKIKDIEEE